MKSVLIIAPFLLALVQCTTQSSSPSPKLDYLEKWEQERKERLAAFQKEEDEFRAAGKPLIINGRGCVVDSAGGNKVNVNFKNTSGKPIKYIEFNVAFLNPVGDRAMCSITGKSLANLKVIGPFEDGEFEDAFWEPSIYYKAWCYIEILSIKIDYMDGSSKFLQKSEVDRLGGMFGDKLGKFADWNSFSGAKRERDAQRDAITARGYP